MYISLRKGVKRVNTWGPDFIQSTLLHTIISHEFEFTPSLKTELGNLIATNPTLAPGVPNFKKS